MMISQLGRSALVSLNLTQGCFSHHLLQGATLMRVERCSDLSYSWFGSCLIQGLLIGVLEIRAKITMDSESLQGRLTRHDLTPCLPTIPSTSFR